MPTVYPASDGAEGPGITPALTSDIWEATRRKARQVSNCSVLVICINGNPEKPSKITMAIKQMYHQFSQHYCDFQRVSFGEAILVKHRLNVGAHIRTNDFMGL